MNTIVFDNHNLRTRLVLKKALRNQIGKMVSTLELTKERFFSFVKDVLWGYVWVLEKRIRVLEKMEAEE